MGSFSNSRFFLPEFYETRRAFLESILPREFLPKKELPLNEATGDEREVCEAWLFDRVRLQRLWDKDFLFEQHRNNTRNPKKRKKKENFLKSKQAETETTEKVNLLCAK